MIEFCILGSGSGGNSAVVRTPGGCLLVDAGLSASRIRERLQSVGVEPESLGGILVTHEHGDHVSGLSVFTRRHGVPVLTSALTRAALGDKLEKQACRIIPPAGLFSFGGFNIESFAVPHDATCPVGFVLRAGGISLGILSDLGHVTAHARSRVASMDALFVEANYDADLIAADTKRPWSTKQRIMGRHGHLSNEQTATLVREVWHPQLQQVVLGHLSKDCNHPDRVMTAMSSAIQGSTSLCCATQDTPTQWFRIAPAPAPTPPAAPENAASRYEQGLLF